MPTPRRRIPPRTLAEHRFARLLRLEHLRQVADQPQAKHDLGLSEAFAKARARDLRGMSDGELEQKIGAN